MSDKIPKEQESVWVQLVKDVVDVDKGLLITLKTLVRHPDRVVKGYLTDRSFFSPFKLLALSVVLEIPVFAAVRFFFPIQETNQDEQHLPSLFGIDPQILLDFMSIVMPYLGYLYVLFTLIFCNWLVFRRVDRPLRLFAIIDCYLFAMTILLILPLNAFDMAIDGPSLGISFLYMLLLFAYLTWTHARMFQKRLLNVGLRMVLAFTLFSFLLSGLLLASVYIYAVL